MHSKILLLLPALMLSSCTSYVEPGAEDLPLTHVALVRESKRVYDNNETFGKLLNAYGDIYPKNSGTVRVLKLDKHEVKSFMPANGRQLTVLPGKRRFEVTMHGWNSSKNRVLTANLKPGGTYHLEPNRKNLGSSYKGNYIKTLAVWFPTIVDSSTGKVISKEESDIPEDIQRKLREALMNLDKKE